MIAQTTLSRIRSLLEQAFGGRLAGVILYGSQARGDSGPDSDIDLLVLLKGPVRHREDLWTCVRTLYPLVLELERPIHAKPVALDRYEAQVWPLYQQAKAEGIAV